MTRHLLTGNDDRPANMAMFAAAALELLAETLLARIGPAIGIRDALGAPATQVLVRRAATKLRESTKAWANYAQAQGAETVLPLMVMQLPNTPHHNDVGKMLDTVFAEWPELPPKSVAHVLGEHTTQEFGPHSVPYIPPQRVQNDTWVRIVIAKDAISTGWDCPRAETMVSFRSAKDDVNIAQLIGRMVRAPLARHIEVDETLNDVSLYLPYYDAATVENERRVAEAEPVQLVANILPCADAGGPIPDADLVDQGKEHGFTGHYSAVRRMLGAVAATRPAGTSSSRPTRWNISTTPGRCLPHSVAAPAASSCSCCRSRSPNTGDRPSTAIASTATRCSCARHRNGCSVTPPCRTSGLHPSGLASRCC